MSDFLVSVETPPSPSTSRRKPKLVIRGLRRKNVKRLMQALKVQFKDDERESARGNRMGYTPFLFFGTASSNRATAARALITRCEQLLTMRR